MASHPSSGCETGSSRQTDTPKLEKRLSTVDNLVDEIVVAGIESALRETSLDSPAHAQPSLTHPRTPYIHPIPVNHMPLPTIETLLSYTSLPQGHHESLVNGTSRVATSTCSSASTPTRARTDSASSIASDGSEERWYDSIEGGEESAAWGEPEGARELQGTVVYGAAGVAVSPRAMRRERREVTFCGGRELGRIEETEEEHRWLKLL